MIHLFVIRRVAVPFLFVAILLVLPQILWADPLAGTPASFEETRAVLAHRFTVEDEWRLLYRSDIDRGHRFTRISWVDARHFLGPLEVLRRQQEGSLENLAEAQLKYQKIINRNDYKRWKEDCPNSTLSVEKSQKYAFYPYALVLKGKLSDSCKDTGHYTYFLDKPPADTPIISWDYTRDPSVEAQSFIWGNVQYAAQYLIKASALLPVQIKASDFEALVKDFKAKGWIPSAKSDTGSSWFVVDTLYDEPFDTVGKDISEYKHYGLVRRAIFAQQIAPNKACGLILDWVYVYKAPVREIAAYGLEVYSGPQWQKVMDMLKSMGAPLEVMAELAKDARNAEKAARELKNQPDPDLPYPMVGTMFVVHSACGEDDETVFHNFLVVKKRRKS
ncbi:MAG: hypothetical protein OWQ56_00190 [Acidithiobacillus caldus]|nr:hypothetical protein [Acidithiobacillus caldus]